MTTKPPSSAPADSAVAQGGGTSAAPPALRAPDAIADSATVDKAAERAAAQGKTLRALHHTSILPIGVPKCGKSALVATMPQPVHVMDFDQGALTLLTHPVASVAFKAGRLTIDTIALTAGWPDVIQAFKKTARLVKAGHVRTVAIDSGTYMLRAIERSMTEAGGFNPEADEPAHVDLRRISPNVARLAKHVITMALSWNCHLVMTMHEDRRDVTRSGRDNKGDMVQIPTGDIIVVPQVLGNDLRANLASMFDEVWRSVKAIAKKDATHARRSVYHVHPNEIDKIYQGYGSKLGLGGTYPNSFPALMQGFLDGGGDHALYDNYMRELPTADAPKEQ